MELIDRRALIDGFIASCNTGYESFPLDFIFEAIEQVPAIDAVPVVRCSDCTHRIGGTSENIELRCGLKKAGMEMGLPFIMPSYYCSHGERKTGENNNRP